MAKFLNPFLVGADPELILVNGNNLVNGQTRPLHAPDIGGFFGFDHGGWVLEPHPIPNRSVRQVCHNLRAALDFLHYAYPDLEHKSGAYYNFPRQRTVTLGGHVHLDIPALSQDQIGAMDILTESMERLDILPNKHCAQRVVHGYGWKGDVRAERGRVEYRSMCSWLFSRKTSMLCMTSIKLAAVAPKTVPLDGFDSPKAIATWLEGFKGEDDDAKWILEKNYFGADMTANPDANVTQVWRTSAERGKDLADALVKQQVKQAVNNANRMAHTMGNIPRNIPDPVGREWADQ